MEINLNDQQKQVANGITVQQLLDIEIPEKQKGIAVAINNSVVSKTNWSTTILNQHDNVLIIKATQGG